MLNLETLFDVPFTFALRPSPLPADLRPVWRLTTLTMSVYHCRGDRASLEQLHVLNWALGSAETRAAFLRFLAGTRKPDDAIVRLEPSLSRAVAFALHEGLIQKIASRPKGTTAQPAAPLYRIGLTQLGRSLAEAALSANDCFLVEQRFFKEVTQLTHGKLTQAQVQNLFHR